MLHRHIIAFSIAFSLAVGTGAVKSPAVELNGSCADVYHGRVCTWATTQNGHLLEVGATIPFASIENAPKQNPNAMKWPPVAVASLDLPEPARRASSFTQLTMYWESRGHPPASYMTPHFDFHFNTISANDRLAIDCTDTAKPAAVPVAYRLPNIPLPPDMAKMMGVPVLVGLCVPKMGMHALLESEIDRTDMFRGSMVLGYYHGKLIFLEPMLTRVKLLEKKSFDLPIPMIPGVGVQPTKFHAEYDAATSSYRFAFSGFSATAASPPAKSKASGGVSR